MARPKEPNGQGPTRDGLGTGFARCCCDLRPYPQSAGLGANPYGILVPAPRYHFHRPRRHLIPCLGGEKNPRGTYPIRGRRERKNSDCVTTPGPRGRSASVNIRLTLCACKILGFYAVRHRVRRKFTCQQRRVQNPCQTMEFSYNDGKGSPENTRNSRVSHHPHTMEVPSLIQSIRIRQQTDTSVSVRLWFTSSAANVIVPLFLVLFPTLPLSENVQEVSEKSCFFQGSPSKCFASLIWIGNVRGTPEPTLTRDGCSNLQQNAC